MRRMAARSRRPCIGCRRRNRSRRKSASIIRCSSSPIPTPPISPPISTRDRWKCFPTRGLNLRSRKPARPIPCSSSGRVISRPIGIQRLIVRCSTGRSACATRLQRKSAAKADGWGSGGLGRPRGRRLSLPFRGGAAHRRGRFGVPSVIVALAWPGSSVQSFLHGSLPQSFIPGVDDRLIADIGEIGLVAGERENAGLAREHLAPDGEINLLDAVHEAIASCEIFCLDFCPEAFGALPGLLCVGGRRPRNDSNDKCRDYENAHLADPWG